ncbi:MAG: hypothetical protein KAT47_04865 [Candidatus Aegiribacteria sp.]|nr:hypothetical protein [Candidatus Aegiribacteria sp.]
MIILLLFSIPALCGELLFGPRVGLLMPGNFNGVSTHPGPGGYFGTAAELPLSSLIAVELTAGAALGMGEPLGDQLPGYPSYDNHDADYFLTDLALSVNPAFLTLAAGFGYYYIHMDWEQDLTGYDSEWKTVELNRIGYHFSVGVHYERKADFTLTFHFPEPGNMWGMISLTLLSFEVQIP